MGRHERITRALTALKRQGLTLLGLAMIVAGGIWAAVAWASSEIEIDTPRGEETVDLNDVDQDVKKQRYSVDGRKTKAFTGSSLQKVLSSVGVEPDEWARILVNSKSVVNGEKFVDKLKPVFVLDDNKNAFFVVPKREGQDGEIAKGQLTIDLLGAIAIEWNEKKPKQGDTRTFTATVVDGGAQNKYLFKWSAAGETGSDREFDYTFDSAGNVEISVRAELNESPVAEGAISTKVKAKSSDDDGSDDGSGDGTDTGTGDTGSGTDYGSGYDSGPGYTPNFSSPDTGGSSPNFPDTPAPKDPNEEPTLDETGISVTGELLSAVTELSPSSSEGGAAAEDETEPATDPEVVADEAKEVSAPGALIAGGIIVGLLGLGAGRELESVRPRRLLRRPDLSGLRRLSPPWK